MPVLMLTFVNGPRTTNRPTHRSLARSLTGLPSGCLWFIIHDHYYSIRSPRARRGIPAADHRRNGSRPHGALSTPRAPLPARLLRGEQGGAALHPRGVALRRPNGPHAAHQTAGAGAGAGAATTQLRNANANGDRGPRIARTQSSQGH